MFVMTSSRGYPDAVESTDLYWLAGLLEGEGSFLTGPPSAPRYPVLALQMTDQDVVARVAAMFGRKLGRWQSRHAREQPVFLVRITGAKAVAWMTALRPLMGERRRAQIDRAVASHAPSPTALLNEKTARHALTLLATGSTCAKSLIGSVRASGASTTCASEGPTSTSRAREHRRCA